MSDRPTSTGGPERLTRRRRFWIWLFIAVVLAAILLIIVPLAYSPSCVTLVYRSARDVAIPLPANCSVVSNAAPNDMVGYLENERNRRGLVFKEWIACDSSHTKATNFAFQDDPHWLPSYIPNTYQFRRTVIILPYGQGIPGGSQIAAEVALVPWRTYVSQIMGECDGKFSVWK